jgi:hypothetical protein
MALTASGQQFAVTITNQGLSTAGTFTIKFTLDAIYTEDPGTKLVTVESLPAGSSLTVETVNDLASAEGRGEHYLAAQILPDGPTQGVHFYDGDYLSEYQAMSAARPEMQAAISSQLQSELDFPCSNLCYVRLIDTMEGSSAAMTVRNLFGSSEGTVIILFNLGRLHDGYATYESGGTIYISDTSAEVMYHEYAHAYQMQYVGLSGGRWDAVNIPIWFREGFAVYSAGHGPNLVKRLIARSKHDGLDQAATIAKLLDGLTCSPHEGFDYAEDYLALAYIVANYGADKYKEIVQTSAAGTSVEAAIVSGLSLPTGWAGFETDFENYAQASLEALYPLIN